MYQLSRFYPENNHDYHVIPILQKTVIRENSNFIRIKLQQIATLAHIFRHRFRKSHR